MTCQVGVGLRVVISFGSRVAAALEAGHAVVALESTIVSHGLPRPRNLSVAREIEQAVEAAGAVPATIGMIGGRVTVGLDDAQIEHLATSDNVVKLSVRDLAPAAASKADGATTVASTAFLAARADIAVFATGGLGGVHRDAPFDESADLTTLSRTPIVVVCAGVKSILDVGATLERLETLGVAVVGYRTTRFPGFYLRDAGFDLDWSVDTPEQVAAIMAARLGDAAVLVANPLPSAEQLDPDLHDRVLAEAMAGLARDRVTGKAVTPYLLAHFHAATSGASLAANVRIILRNAELGGRIAVAHAALR
jgi:pseudouridine-5'-phosphate glycosidase